METKVNLSAIEEYSEIFAEKISEDFFSQASYIKGEDILKLTGIKQINIFVVKALFDQWQKEIENQKSPYFDYENEQVREALGDYMNVVSRHIKMKKDSFKPLLKTAVFDTIRLIFSPFEYLTTVTLPTESPSKVFTLDDLKTAKKYTKIYPEVIDSVINKASEYNDATISAFEIGQILERSCKDVYNSDITVEFLEEFSQTIPLSLQTIYGYEKSYDQHEYDKQDSNATSQNIKEPVVTTPVNDNEPHFAQQQQANGSEYTVNNNEETAIAEPVKQQQTQDETNTATINDTWAGEQKSKTLADMHTEQPVTSLNSVINLNQKFRFINELFEGNNEIYSEAIDKIESYNDYSSVIQFIKTEYLLKYNWQMDNETVIDFLNLVSKRFNK
ncbi:hypothetical protein [Aureibacter tunicatorum]|uniref:Uncharacterized protein n=1 Tax=Aureibacter tunicatorum TaxID=866807 RepID=A0AAE3XLD0_9BACT|nr:hypothetical protein [Aureibacter tunicatorum]MDR6238728.1 hypothetical protein [Aureibacter tunicatorum]BDD05341.1 hypothetical protein AUTU_28240 [Aureibacter tunicatorum]